MRRRLLMFLLGCLGAGLAHAGAGDSLWTSLQQGGNIVLLRHAQTGPGIGDPPGFTLGRCDTQRNLSDQGRADAAALGAQFRRRAIAVDAVWSSRWCRALDTATLAFGRATPAPMLDSMFKDRARSDADAKIAALFAMLAARGGAGGNTGGNTGGKPGGNIVLVTHAVNVAALTGISPASGEMIVTRLSGPRTLTVVARGLP